MRFRSLICAGLFLIFGLGGVLSSVPATAVDQLVVHEWGTFTALQDEAGKALGGINIDDEPVPSFVHNLHPDLLAPSHAVTYVFMKGVPQRHPYVTLRLETPVMYFYPPPGEKLPLKVDVDVAFHGGWLSEFFPKADAEAPGVNRSSGDFGPLTRETTSRLTWRGVQVGATGKPPATNENVWLAPRNVNATPITAASGESEKFLFYRGVGNFDAPLATTLNADFSRVSLHGRFAEVLASGQTARIDSLWLVHVRADGTSAFRRVAPVKATADNAATIGQSPATFDAADFSATNLDRLKEEMHRALVEAGLFKDEATALLTTWQRAYFRSPGLRLFFLVPQAWTDHYLPLKLSVPADITRVMMGRVELISPEQRALLAKLATVKVSDKDWINKVQQTAENRGFFEGRTTFGDLGVKIPDDYQAYLDLGRFRNALVLNEARRRPTDSLQKFVATYQLERYAVPKDAGK